MWGGMEAKFIIIYWNAGVIVNMCFDGNIIIYWSDDINMDVCFDSNIIIQ